MDGVSIWFSPREQVDKEHIDGTDNNGNEKYTYDREDAEGKELTDIDITERDGDLHVSKQGEYTINAIKPENGDPGEDFLEIQQYESLGTVNLGSYDNGE